MKTPLFWDIAVKNLKTTLRDKKTLLFVILIPIFFYTLMGLLFGTTSADTEGYVYSIGFVDLDSTSANNPQYPNYNISYMLEIMKDVDSLNIKEYITHESAEKALNDLKIDAFIEFPDGFELFLNESGDKAYAMYDNDTTSSSAFTHSIDNFMNVTGSYMNVTNITSQDFGTFMSTFNESGYDYVLLFQDGFEAALDAGTMANATLFHRSEISNELLTVEVETIKSTMEGFFLQVDPPASKADIVVDPLAAPGSNPKPVKQVSIFFRDSTEQLTRNIITATVQSIIDGIINFNPNEIPLEFNEQTVTNIEKNSITLSGPGYLMYGMLSILSMATILITMERKSGNLKRLESTRMRSMDMLGGHVISNTIILFMQFGIGVGVLSIFGLRVYPGSILSLITGISLNLVLTSLFLNGLALVAGTLFKTPEASGGGVWIFLIPLMTFSGAFFPLELVAPTLVPYVRWIPTRITVLIFQDLMINESTLLNPQLWINFGVLALFGIVLFIIGMKLYGRFARST
ncbi:ABC transporter permease subunit [Candidatus Bathyarchaeota archaeon]|nr:ABC transporter permease subunit [Candidatus Bathyarchaeota archaeon]